MIRGDSQFVAERAGSDFFALLRWLGNSGGGMGRQIFFISGTDTGVGKTVLATLLTRHLRQRGLNAVGLKPICSGGREDALSLWRASEKILSLDEINPWHFRAPLSPLLAARKDRKRVHLEDVVAHIRAIQKRFEAVVVEGAGGLLSPLGENFDSRDLLLALRATPIVVCPNRLGAANQVLLVWEALPKAARRNAQIVLMNPRHFDAAAQTNPSLLARFIGPKRIHLLPHLRDNASPRLAAVLLSKLVLSCSRR